MFEDISKSAAIANQPISLGVLALKDTVNVSTYYAYTELNLKTMVAGFGDHELWLGLSTVNETIARFVEGQKMTLTSPRGAGVVICETTFKRHLDKNHHRLFAVHFMENGVFTQRRQHLRLNVNLPLQIRYRDQEYNGQSIDLSAGGVRLFTKAPMVRGDTARFLFKLSGLSLSLDAEVIRAEKAQKGNLADVYEVAAHFTKISQDAQDRIARFVFMQMR